MKDDYLVRKNFIIAPVLQGFKGTQILFSIYKNSLFSITSRFHSCIGNINYKLTAISTLNRINYLFKSIDMSEYCVSLDSDFFQIIIENFNSNKKPNFSKLENFKKESLKTYESIFKQMKIL
ncbi:hypothetical protein CGP82_04300 [Campylobacter sp. LR185c]|nr:hypothetical protein CGP82_04300 [Campylobacter sp. LR185c]